MTLTLKERIGLKIKGLNLEDAYGQGSEHRIYSTNFDNLLFRLRKMDPIAKYSRTVDIFYQEILVSEYLRRNNIDCCEVFGVYNAEKIEENVNGLLMRKIEGENILVFKILNKDKEEELELKMAEIERKVLSLEGINHIDNEEDDFIYDVKTGKVSIIDFGRWDINYSVINKELKNFELRIN